ncbi:6888_t:CDS:2 [Entrophospora sp. SA101]|nr:6888_t:CDS:2 [Entrophospora sp. SA101]
MSNVLDNGSEKYSNWSKQELIAKLLTLEKQQLLLLQKEEEKQEKQNEIKRLFDMSKYAKRRIAFKLAYFGWNYYGFETQNDESRLPTIEGRLFQAMINSKLISDPSDCRFSKCGRTDKGVSAFGQVIALNIRSNLPKNSPLENQELPYLQILNRLLPNDIRIIAWAPVNKNFDARFNCKSRKYKYYFVQENLDIELMREAANKFLGTHDFRNFCKIDGSKQIKNFERTVLEVGIYPMNNKNNSDINSGSDNVGKRLEKPSVIDDLLDVKKFPAKPVYDIANELPLVLYNSLHAPTTLYKQIYEQWYIHATKANIHSNLLNNLESRSQRNYVKIINRKTCDSVESKNANFKKN